MTMLTSTIAWCTPCVERARRACSSTPGDVISHHIGSSPESFHFHLGALSLNRPLPSSFTFPSCLSPSTSSTTSCPLSSTTRSSWKACATPPQKRVRAPWTPPTPSHFLDMGRQRICLDVQTIQKPKNGRKKGKDQKGKRQGKCLSTDRIFSLWKRHGRRTRPSPGTKRWVLQLLWRFFNECVVQSKIFSLDGVSSLGSFPPSEARCSGSWLHTINGIENSTQKVPEICVVSWYYDRILSLARSLLCLPTLRQKLVWKVVLFICRQHHHVLPELMCLGRATCLSYSPFTRWRIWVLHLNWIQKELRLHVQPVACTLHQSTTPQWDMLCWIWLVPRICQSRLSEPESKKKSACPARPQEVDDDADDIPIVHSDRSTVSEEEDEVNKPLVQPSSGRKQLKRESSATRRVPTPLCQKTSRGRSEDVSSMGKHSDGEALKKIINTLSDVSSLKDLRLKHYHTSSAQFKKRTTHLDIPRKVYDLYQHVVKTCPFCNSTKPRPDRSRVSGLRTEEFGDLIFLDHGSTQVGDQTFGFLIVLDGVTSHVTACPC